MIDLEDKAPVNDTSNDVDKNYHDATKITERG